MSIFYTGNPLNKITKVTPIFMAINNAYVPYAAVTINSLTRNTDKKRYYRVIILHDGISLINRIKLRNLVTPNVAIQLKRIDNSLYLKSIVRYCSKQKGVADFFSSAVYYYRFFAPMLFPRYAKGVYIDSDTILRADIGELLDIDLEDKVLAAMADTKVREIPEFGEYVEKALKIPREEYANSGVMVMDLKKMRKERFIQRMVEMIQKYDADLVAPDQDYLNVILRGKIKYFGEEWNMQPANPMPRNAKLIHFNLTYKPWHHKNVPCGRLFWSAAKGTGYKGILKRQQDAFAEDQQKAEMEKIEALIKKAAKLAKSKKPLIK